MTIEPAFVFLPEKGESLKERMVRCAHYLLEDGPIGQYTRGEWYLQFMACGFEPNLKNGNGIETLRSSCGMFIRGLRHWAGDKSKRPGEIGAPLLDYKLVNGEWRGAWLEELNMLSRCWKSAKEMRKNLEQPKAGFIFYSDDYYHSNGHVGIILTPGENLWMCAEGGGIDPINPKNNYSLCRITFRKPWEVDKSGRPILGFWDLPDDKIVGEM